MNPSFAIYDLPNGRGTNSKLGSKKWVAVFLLGSQLSNAHDIGNGQSGMPIVLTKRRTTLYQSVYLIISTGSYP
jgi:hypothetical protein